MNNRFTCCRCGDKVGVVNTVSKGNIALKMFECKGSTWHGSWHEQSTKALHIICSDCEETMSKLLEAMELFKKELGDRETLFINIPGEEKSEHDGRKYDHVHASFKQDSGDILVTMIALALILEEDYPTPLIFRPLEDGENLVVDNICLNYRKDRDVQIYSVLVAR